MTRFSSCRNGPVCADAQAQVVRKHKGVGRDRNDSGKPDRALTCKRHELIELLPVFGTIYTPAKHYDHGIVTLEE
jgi:hypothetical protein